MDRLNILVTGGGSPGIAGTLYSLKNHRVVCTDMRTNVPGEYLADKFYQIRPATDVYGYLMDIMDICYKEKIHVILPQNTIELDVLQDEVRFVPVAGNRNISKDRISKGVMVHTFDELLEYGSREGTFVVKPPNSNGSRGIRIITDSQRDFYRKPGIPIMNINELYREIGESFRLWAMPFYEGQEVTVDCFRGRGRFAAIPRTREDIRSGISFSGRVFHDSELIDQCKVLAHRFDLRYAFGFQFIDGKVLECNPRVQGTMVVSTLAGANIIEAACLEALDMALPDWEIDYNFKYIRYWGLIAKGVTI